MIDNISTADAVAVKIWKTAPYSLELDELKSVAYMGLVASALRWEDFCIEYDYDSSRTEYFRAYSIKRIQGSIYDHFRSTDWATRALRSKAKLLNEAGLEDGASEEEMIARTGLSQKQVRSTRIRMANSPIPLEEAMAGEFEPSTRETTADVVESKFLLTAFVNAVMALPDEQQTVLILKYFEGVDLKSVAARTGMPEAKVSKLHTDGVVTVHDALVKYLGKDILT